MPRTAENQILIKFGQNLKKIREKKGVSLRKLEILSDVDFSQIHRIEKGITNPSLTIIIAIAKALEIDTKDLLDF